MRIAGKDPARIDRRSSRLRRGESAPPPAPCGRSVPASLPPARPISRCEGCDPECSRRSHPSCLCVPAALRGRARRDVARARVLVRV